MGSTPSRPTAHTLRWRFDARRAISHLTSQPTNPRGCLNWDRSASASFCFLSMTSVNSLVRAFRPWRLTTWRRAAGGERPSHEDAPRYPLVRSNARFCGARGRRGTSLPALRWSGAPPWSLLKRKSPHLHRSCSFIRVGHGWDDHGPPGLHTPSTVAIVSATTS